MPYGMFHAIDENIAQKLMEKCKSEIVDYVMAEINELFWEEHKDQVVEMESAWDSVHKVFSEGSMDYYDPTKGTYPSNFIIFGGKVLFGNKDSEHDAYMTLKKPSEVKDICSFLSNLTESEFRALYFEILKNKQGFDVSEQDFKWIWEELNGTVEFWKNASKKNLWVIFTVEH